MVDSEAAENLPQEIITEILTFLPVKSIGRSRCVSKPWRSLLTSNEFIKSHLARHTHLPVQEEKLLLLSNCHSLFTLTLHPDICLSRKLERESFDKKLVCLVGSCNGLVLAVTEGDGTCLINCLTLEYAELPASPFPSACFTLHGFGYDCLSDDYKIVSLSYYDKDNKHPDCADDTLAVDIYTVKTRSWRRLGSFPSDYIEPKLASEGVFVNGVLHWMRRNSDNSYVIVAFDLSSEKFEEIPGPVFPDTTEYVAKAQVVIEGCLGIVVSQLIEEVSDRMVEVWVMNTYSMAESWTKTITIDLLDMGWSPVYFHKDKLLIYVGDDAKFFWYYPDDERCVEWMINTNHLEFKYGETYSETLVSPHFDARS